MDQSPESRPSRDRLKRNMRSLRSGIRRYPSAIALSILNKDAGVPIGACELLHQLAPHDLAISWLGHAGVVCQLQDTVMAVDPVLSPRIGPRVTGRTIGPQRLSEVPLPASALRGVSLVLLTHAHFDHLDKPTLQKMASRDTEVIVPRGCSRLVPRGFARIIELSVDDEVEIAGVQIRALEPKHWGARTALDRRRGVNSYLVRSDDSTVLFTGDTAETDVFEPLDDVDVAVFGIGAYNPWDHMHATPEQVWSMFRGMGARYLLPVHHSTFELSDEPIDEPLARLLEAAGDFHDVILSGEPGDVMVIDTTGL